MQYHRHIARVAIHRDAIAHLWQIQKHVFLERHAHKPTKASASSTDLDCEPQQGLMVRWVAGGGWLPVQAAKCCQVRCKAASFEHYLERTLQPASVQQSQAGKC